MKQLFEATLVALGTALFVVGIFGLWILHAFVVNLPRHGATDFVSREALARALEEE